MKILKIEKIDYSEDVYNLHIEDNHNYFANDICVSNCHSLKGNEVRKVAENAINCTIRIGCTGTMPDQKSSKMQIEGMLGPIIHRVTAKELIDGGQASDIIIKIPYIVHPSKILDKLKGSTFEIEKDFLEKYEPRNNAIRAIIKKHKTKNHNCLILVDHKDHANILFEKIKELNDGDTFLVTGDMPAPEREKIRQYTNNNEKVVIVATYGVFSTGISIKKLHCVIFGSAGKSKIKVLQSIGRGLRLHKDKKGLILYDIGDNLKYSEKHLQERIDMYTKAQFNIDVFELNLIKE
jgi:superfamily II DNA or RNA helicase